MVKPDLYIDQRCHPRNPCLEPKKVYGGGKKIPKTSFFVEEDFSRQKKKTVVIVCRIFNWKNFNFKIRIK